jgi:hypothetical protein
MLKYQCHHSEYRWWCLAGKTSGVWQCTLGNLTTRVWCWVEHHMEHTQGVGRQTEEGCVWDRWPTLSWVTTTMSLQAEQQEDLHGSITGFTSRSLLSCCHLSKIYWWKAVLKSKLRTPGTTWHLELWNPWQRNLLSHCHQYRHGLVSTLRLS